MAKVVIISEMAKKFHGKRKLLPDNIYLSMNFPLTTHLSSPASYHSPLTSPILAKFPDKAARENRTEVKKPKTGLVQRKYEALCIALIFKMLQIWQIFEEKNGAV